MTFNDFLALLLAVVVIPTLWIGQGLGELDLPGEVIGATITIETLITQYYYRKAKTSLKGKKDVD